MRLAVLFDRCEVVAAFTNPTLHRIISQRLFFRLTGRFFSSIRHIFHGK
jgi:hypothetical protein